MREYVCQLYPLFLNVAPKIFCELRRKPKFTVQWVQDTKLSVWFVKKLHLGQTRSTVASILQWFEFKIPLPIKKICLNLHKNVPKYNYAFTETWDKNQFNSFDTYFFNHLSDIENKITFYIEFINKPFELLNFTIIMFQIILKQFLKILFEQ